MAGSGFPRRQVHLDFHTAAQAPDVGADFDADEFVETLKDARVNSVTCFSTSCFRIAAAPGAWI